MKRMRNLKGFTLVELIVVILIIGILAAIAVIGYTNITKKANETAEAANAKQVVSALSADATLTNSASVAVFLDGLTAGNETADLGEDYTDAADYLGKFGLTPVPSYDPATDIVTVGGTSIDVSGQVAQVK